MKYGVIHQAALAYSQLQGPPRLYKTGAQSKKESKDASQLLISHLGKKNNLKEGKI